MWHVKCVCVSVCVRFSQLLCVDTTRRRSYDEREREREDEEEEEEEEGDEGGKVSKADGQTDGWREGGKDGWSIASVSRQQHQREAGIHPLLIHSFISASNPLFFLCCFILSFLSVSPGVRGGKRGGGGRREGWRGKALRYCRNRLRSYRREERGSGGGEVEERGGTRRKKVEWMKDDGL